MALYQNFSTHISTKTFHLAATIRAATEATYN